MERCVFPFRHQAENGYDGKGYVAGVDELNMSVMRVRLRFDDRTIAQSQFKKKFGQLQYLENLRKSDYSKKGGQNPELCPICRNALGSAWSVMQVSLLQIIHWRLLIHRT